MKRAALIAFVTLLALYLLVESPFLLSQAIFRWTTSKWENQIKREEDPEKLRAWAKEILERYKDNPFQQSVIATNRPPIAVKIQHEFTLIYYADAETNGQTKLNPTQDFVNVDCDFGAWTGDWGLEIGETNFVSRSKKKNREWKPGIYFYRGGPD